MSKSKIIALFSVVILSAFFVSYRFNDNNANKNEVLLQVMMQSLSSAHYQPEDINDSLSKRVFDEYLKSLDFGKKFLTQEDVNELKKQEFQIDEQINKGTYEFFEQSTDIINSRIKEAEAYYKEILTTPFDFSKEETLELNYEKAIFPANKEGQKEAWRKYLKYETLIRLADAQEIQDKAKAKNDTSVKIKTFAELEQEARKKVEKSQSDLFKRLSKIEKTDRLSVYLNSIAQTYDPHTEYFAPKEKEQFDIAMTGQLEGIGAQLQEKDGNIKVTNIVPGSASWRQGQLKAGDVILKVAQGALDPVDIVDMRLDNAVTLIRGKKGTEVRLTVKKPDASIIIIPIIRDVVVIEETYAQSAILKNKKSNIGYIKLPGFYADFNHNGGRTSSTDVKNEVLKLKQEKVDGIILDLRDNGGGSLQDVVDMGGLFINKGPIVQVKAKDQAPSTLEDNDPSIYYDGPFVIMVNASSASASEIMAAAMQDYKRAVIVGTSNSTFGKGTVQRILNLDDYLIPDFRSFKPLGSIKVTIQKFYRVNGGATQLRGVTPDIILPDVYSQIEFGEKEQDYVMPWDEIAPAQYNKWNKAINLEKIKKNSLSRVQGNSSFKLVTEEAMKVKRQKDSTVVSLNWDKYRKESRELKEEAKKFEVLNKAITDFDVTFLKADIPSITADSSKAARNNEWKKNLKKDIYLFEGTSIIKDMLK